MSHFCHHSNLKPATLDFAVLLVNNLPPKGLSCVRERGAVGRKEEG